MKAISFGHGNTRLAQKKEIRKIMNEMIATIAKKNTFEKFLQEVIYGKVGSEMFKPVKKIYPVSKTEVIKCKILSEPTKKK